LQLGGEVINRVRYGKYQAPWGVVTRQGILPLTQLVPGADNDVFYRVEQ
jgi:hypothetical protein